MGPQSKAILCLVVVMAGVAQAAINPLENQMSAIDAHAAVAADSSACPESYIYDSRSATCVCPADSYSDIQGRCQPCPPPGVWNTETLQCIECPEN